jgi:hypothetical protein
MSSFPFISHRMFVAAVTQGRAGAKPQPPRADNSRSPREPSRATPFEVWRKSASSQPVAPLSPELASTGS